MTANVAPGFASFAKSLDATRSEFRGAHTAEIGFTTVRRWQR